MRPIFENIIYWIAENGWKVAFLSVPFFYAVTLIWGNYPEWEAKERQELFERTFQDERGHLKFKYETRFSSLYRVVFEYSDGHDHNNYATPRTNKEEIKSYYSEYLINKVCFAEDSLERLMSGQRISVDVLDGDKKTGVTILFNLMIDYERCRT